MIEIILKKFLESQFELPIKLENTEKIGSDYIVLDKTGSNYESTLYSSTVAIQSYSSTLYKAAELNEKVKKVMLNELIKLDEINSVELNSDYNYTDTAMKQYRYQAVFDIFYY